MHLDYVSSLSINIINPLNERPNISYHQPHFKFNPKNGLQSIAYIARFLFKLLNITK